MNNEQTIKDIKKELRAAMNGIASKRMRDAGMPYKLIFGVEVPRLQSIAKEFPQNRELSQALWNENIRESKMLACMLMPTDEFFPEMAEIWAEEIPTPEIAQYFTLHLFCNIRHAAEIAFEWIASNNSTKQLCGFLCLTKLMQKGEMFNERSTQELKDQAISLLTTADLHLKKAVQSTILKLEECGNQK